MLETRQNQLNVSFGFGACLQYCMCDWIWQNQASTHIQFYKFVTLIRSTPSTPNFYLLFYDIWLSCVKILGKYHDVTLCYSWLKSNNWMCVEAWIVKFGHIWIYGQSPLDVVIFSSILRSVHHKIAVHAF